jgi:hypothetical protein
MATGLLGANPSVACCARVRELRPLLRDRHWFGGRRTLLAFLVAVALLPATRFTGCADVCEEAIDHCLDCDVEVSTCNERFADGPDAKCQDAVDRYRQGGCDPYAGRKCGGEPEPEPGPGY